MDSNEAVRVSAPTPSEEQVTAPVPRLSFAELAPSLSEMLRPRVDRLGYLGEFFQAMAHQPDTLAAFDGFTEAAKKGLGPRLTEVVALTVASRMNNGYERTQHERLSIRLGYGAEWVAAVERLEPDDTELLTAEDRDVQRIALALLNDHGRGTARAVDGLAQQYGPELAVAVLFVVGRYLVHGTIANALELAPPVPSIFEDGFRGD